VAQPLILGLAQETAAAARLLVALCMAVS